LQNRGSQRGATNKPYSKFRTSMMYVLLLADGIPKKIFIKKITGGVTFFKKVKIRVTFEDNGCAEHQKVARLIVVLYNLPR
jgi:hypothetical protein